MPRRGFIAGVNAPINTAILQAIVEYKRKELVWSKSVFAGSTKKIRGPKYTISFTRGSQLFNHFKTRPEWGNSHVV